MAKKATPDYSKFALVQPPPPPAPAPRPEPEDEKRLLRKRSKQFVTYVTAECHHAMKMYAVESGRFLHDLQIEAIEEWCQRHGLNVTVRVPLIDE